MSTAQNNNNNKILAAFNIVENFKDIYRRPHQRFTAVDGVRACSILYVVFYHALLAVLIGHEKEFISFVQQTPWYFQWILMGDRGVDSFFVISGFLIGQMLFREFDQTGRIDIKRFYIRRTFRLAPAYYLIILLFILLQGPTVINKIMTKTGMGLEEATTAFYQHMLAFALYLNNFLSMQNSHIHFAWSLAIEEQFYVLFSLFLIFGFYRIKNKLYFLILVFLSSFAVRLLFFIAYPELLVTGDILLAGPPEIIEAYWDVIYDNLYTRYGSILPGVILAYVYVHHWDQIKQWMTVRRSNAIVVAASLLVIMTSVLPVFTGREMPIWLHYLFHVGHRNLYAVSVALLVMVSMFPFGLGGLLHKMLSLRLFYPVSQLSYSMYLIHLPVIVLTCLGLRVTGHIPDLNYTNLFIVVFASMIPMLMVSALVYVVIERPFMKLRW